MSEAVAVQTKGVGLRVVACEVSGDGFDQLGQAAKDSSPQTPGGQVTKEALDHVEPRGARRSEVQMKTRMLLQPRFDLGMFVRGVVIQDQMQVAIGWRLLIEQPQELQPLDMPVACLALSDHRAIGDIERGKERGRPVAHIVVGEGAGPAFLHRQARLRAIQSLHLTLLIAAEDQRVLRRIEIEPDDILQLLGKVRIVGDFESAAQMRLESMLAPDAADGRRTQTRSRVPSPGGSSASPPSGFWRVVRRTTIATISGG